MMELTPVLGEREAIAEILATFGGLEEAEEWLAKGAPYAITPRGYRVSRAEVAEAVTAARRMLAQRKPVWTYLWIPEIWPAAAGWIHSVFGKVFWEQLPKLGLRPWTSYVREGWNFTRDRGEALAYAWQRLRADLAEKGLSLSDIARLAWREILAEAKPTPEEPKPVPEEPKPLPEEVKSVLPEPEPVGEKPKPAPEPRPRPEARTWVIPDVGTFRIWHEIPADRTRELARLWKETLNRLKKVKYALTNLYEPLPKEAAVLVQYRGKLWRIPPTLFDRIQGFPLMFGTDRDYTLIHWVRGWGLIPRVEYNPEQLKNLPPVENLGMPLDEILLAVTTGNRRPLEEAIRRRLGILGVSSLWRMAQYLRKDAKRRYVLVSETYRPDWAIRPEEAPIYAVWNVASPFEIMHTEGKGFQIVVLFPLNVDPMPTSHGPLVPHVVRTIHGAYRKLEDALVALAYVRHVCPQELGALEVELEELTHRRWASNEEVGKAVHAAMERLRKSGVNVDRVIKAFEKAASVAQQVWETELYVKLLEEDLEERKRLAGLGIKERDEEEEVVPIKAHFRPILVARALRIPV